MPSEEPKLTPMMQQYLEVKQSLPQGTLLLFRLGDFYEMFHDDAVEGSRLLGITLTRRQDYPMAGIPYHAAETYLRKLMAAGRKVAICEQMEDPKPGKLVKRSLTRILSPGTRLEASQLEETRNQYLAALDLTRDGLRLAWLDLTTGEFAIAAEKDPALLLPVLSSLDPPELLLREGQRESWKQERHRPPFLDELLQFCQSRACSELGDHAFDPSTGAARVLETLGVLNLEGFGIGTRHPGLGVAGALLLYAADNLCAKPENIHSLELYQAGQRLLLDPATQRNLEIFTSLRGQRDGSLLQALDHTVTAGGARRLEQMLIAPLLDTGVLRYRQDIIGAFLNDPLRLTELQDTLGRTRDLSRILGRLLNRLRHPREVGAIRDTLAELPSLRDLLQGFPGESILALIRNLPELPELLSRLQATLADELPAKLEDGGVFRPGHDEELDRLLALTRDNRHWLTELERTEQARTGIKSLKVRFNQAFGYFIEVTKSNLHLVPEDYVRKQTMVNGERFITEELKAREKEIFHAEENARLREAELFAELIETVLSETAALQEIAHTLAETDVLAGWAQLARRDRYCRPVLSEDDRIEILGGRHPVVEQMLRKEELGLAGTRSFVPNDTLLDCGEQQILLLTGPNMAGKSTYIRQVALISLMAQIGCWVPADKCTIGLVDRIFSRVGASDDLARGNSTFMVEMNETANILHHATPRSLIILDEIGRGTSTYDGLSIAWSVVEHLHADPENGPRTLFATHYQELTQLEKYLPRLRNYSVAVKEWNDEIIFVRQVVPGAADRSYGIQVARLAGLPDSVIARASELLAQLESEESTVVVTRPHPKARPRKKVTLADREDLQLRLF